MGSRMFRPLTLLCLLAAPAYAQDATDIGGGTTVFLRPSDAPGDVVFDPFSGIGSTGYQSAKMLRKFIGTELKPEYANQAARFIKEAEQSVGDLFGISAK